MSKNVVILFCCYVLSWSVVAIGYSATASVGHTLAPDKSLVLMPLIMQVFGACFATVPASRLMISSGRRSAFRIGALIGLFGGFMAAYSVYSGNFVLLACSTFIIGMFNGFGEFIKFAASELFVEESEKNRAISVIVSGGVLAAFLGPFVASSSNDYFQWTAAYVGPYVLVGMFCLLSLMLFSLYKDQLSLSESVRGHRAEDVTASGTKKYSVITNPKFLVGTTLGVFAYLIMSTTMDAFPITMIENGLHFSHTTTVLQWHMLAMFAPSYFTSLFLNKFGFTTTSLCGIFLNVVGIAIALQGIEFVNFLIALLFIGLGWNFMYLAGTSLVANISDAERKSAEGYNNLAITAAYALAAPLSAFVIVKFSWSTVGYLSLTFAAIATLVLAGHWLTAARGVK